MAAFKLKRFLTKHAGHRSLIEKIDPDATVMDSSKTIIFGAEPVESVVSVQVEDTIVGWVGGKEPSMLASLLETLAQQEIEKTKLADEVLELYREVNLLYELADKLAVSLDLETIANTIGTEVKRIIAVDHVSIVLFGSSETEGGDWQVLSAASQPFQLPDETIHDLTTKNKAELIDDIAAHPRWSWMKSMCSSMGYAPLSTRGRNLGGIVLVNQALKTFRAADLKILMAIAAQAGSALDHALLYQRSTRDAAEREARLQQQIQALRIEIDEQRQQQKVVEITESAYFRSIRDQRDALRSLLLNPNEE